MDPITRKNPRLRAYDYASAGAYFVTICTQHRLCLFGSVEGKQMILNDVGELVEESWTRLPSVFPGLVQDSFIVMPNHFHAILHLKTPDRTAPDSEEPKTSERPSPTLGQVVGTFKSMMTVKYVMNVKSDGWPSFDGRIWQRNYYEHIIRDEASLLTTRRYIDENPANWAADKEHPDRPQ